MILFFLLFSNNKVIIISSTLIAALTLLIGLNAINGWFPSPVSENANEQMYASFIAFSCVIAVVVGTIFGRDMRGAFSELREENERVNDAKKTINKLANHDSLTGLLNRKAISGWYETVVLKTDFSQNKLAIYFIDLDNFKSINDLFNHESGNKLLKQIGQRLTALSNPSDGICRLGGDEFIIIKVMDKALDTDVFAKCILDAVSEPCLLIGTTADVTASVGIAVAEHAGITFDTIRRRADMAMYKAKHTKKGSFHSYSDSLKREYMTNRNIIDGLNSAIKDDLLDLHFQPKVCLATNNVLGVEALVRWHKGNTNNYRPDQFIPIIEKTELIHEVGEWVIRRACFECQSWHKAGCRLSVAVNVSATQLTRDSFYEVVASALKNSGLAAEYLEIELTEHSVIEKNLGIGKQLSALKRLGIKVAIDDFGTGYSNMSYLMRLNVDVLKLDQTFIKKIEASKSSLAIATSIIKMAHSLGMTIVAEGIETAKASLILKELGCNLGQGYLWSKALPSDDLLSYVKNCGHVSDQLS